MRYVLYIDIFMMVNFIMDLSVINIAAKLAGIKTGTGRRILAALAGTVFAVLLIISGINSLLLRRIIAYFIIIVIMTYIGFNPKTKKEWLTEITIMYCITFVISGAMDGIYFLISQKKGERYGLTAIEFICMAAAGYMVADKAVDAVKKRCIKGNNISDIYIVKIKKGKNMVQTMGLYDSGNSLTEPFTGKAVHIAGKSIVERLVEEKNESHMKMFIVPYRSIGNENGVIKAYEMDVMVIENEKENVILNKPLVGCYEGNVSSNGSYEIILNREI